jgi:hypothetical protein
MPRIIAGLLILWGLFPNLYPFYILLRFIVCGVSGYTAYRYAQIGRDGSVWLFGAIAVLYNPILSFYLTREIWLPVDVLVAILFLWSAFRERRGADVA